jgi:hypothetical protein
MSMKAWWIAFIGGLAFLVIIALAITRMYSPSAPLPAEAEEAGGKAAPAETAHITASLFFGTEDGQGLVPLRRDVPLAPDVVDQGRQILIAQLSEPAPSPYVDLIPEGTMLRAFYVTPQNDAFIDLSSEIVSGHPGGSLNEMLTVYALVHAVTANLPAIRRVQILVDGKEVDTLAGHVDLRRPLTRDPSLVKEEGSETP